MPHIQTTDGEDMVLHEATFCVRSPDIARASLRSHPDYEHDPSADVYVWVEARNARKRARRKQKKGRKGSRRKKR